MDYDAASCHKNPWVILKWLRCLFFISHWWLCVWFFPQENKNLLEDDNSLEHYIKNLEEEKSRMFENRRHEGVRGLALVLTLTLTLHIWRVSTWAVWSFGRFLKLEKMERWKKIVLKKRTKAEEREEYFKLIRMTLVFLISMTLWIKSMPKNTFYCK